MKKSFAFIAFFCLSTTLMSWSNGAVGAETDLNKIYIESPEKFIHVNSNCQVCLISRRANAGCVVVENGKVLVVKDARTKRFGLPGGKKNKHETAILTAQRNVFEETGLVVYIDDFISEFKNGFRLYKCKIIKDTETLDQSRTLEIKYVDKKELGELLKKNNRKNLRFPHELELVYSKFEWVIK